MKQENHDKDQNNPNSNDEGAEEILNEIEKSSEAESNTGEGDLEAAEGDESLLGKMGFGKKDKHKKELKELKDKLDEVNDKYLRLFAEFDNVKKRNARERMELIKTAGQDVIASMLGTLDDFTRAIKLMETAVDVQGLKDGVFLIYNKMRTTLEAQGLKEMESIGKDFDPELHDAITEIPAPTEALKGKVVDEVEKGYTLNGKIIRHAKVIIGR